MRKIAVMLAIPATLGVLGTVVQAQSGSVTEPETGQSFPVHQDFGNKDHTLIGVGAREAYGAFNVYAAGFYVDTNAAAGSWRRFLERQGASFVHGTDVNWAGLKDASALYQWIYSSSFGKAIWMKFVRDVTGQQVVNAFKDTLRRSIDDFETALSENEALKAFLAAANHDVASGQEMKLWTRGSTVYLHVPGQPPATVENASSIIRPIWRIWFGPNPIQTPLRRGMVNNLENLGGPGE